MILSHTKKFIFFCNPKTGTTSLENALQQYDQSHGEDFFAPGLFPLRHIPPVIVRSVVSSDIWSSYFKFVFVRHPIDWVVSQFRWNFPPPDIYLKKLVWVPRRIPETVREFLTFRKYIHNRPLTGKDINFLHDFLYQFRCIPSYDTLYQSVYVFDVDNNQIVDFVGHLEDLEKDTNEIRSRLSTDFQMPHLNRSKRKSALESLTNDGIESIYKLWSKDFDRLGYEKKDIDEMRKQQRDSIST